MASVHALFVEESPNIDKCVFCEKDNMNSTGAHMFQLNKLDKPIETLYHSSFDLKPKCLQ